MKLFKIAGLACLINSGAVLPEGYEQFKDLTVSAFKGSKVFGFEGSEAVYSNGIFTVLNKPAQFFNLGKGNPSDLEEVDILSYYYQNYLVSKFQSVHFFIDSVQVEDAQKVKEWNDENPFKVAVNWALDQKLSVFARYLTVKNDTLVKNLKDKDARIRELEKLIPGSSKEVETQTDGQVNQGVVEDYELRSAQIPQAAGQDSGMENNINDQDFPDVVPVNHDQSDSDSQAEPVKKVWEGDNTSQNEEDPAQPAGASQDEEEVKSNDADEASKALKKGSDEE